MTEDVAAVAGVDIGGTQCSVNVLSVRDGEARLLYRDQFPTAAARGPEAVLADIERRLQVALSETPVHVAGIGISCGGPLDADLGVIQGPPNLPGWDDVPITERFGRRFQLPVWLENDANACALAEWRLGAGQGTRHMVYLTFGTGLGAGIIADGRLVRGARGLAGEVGHWRLGPPEGPVQYGKQGSFEAYCSGAGIAGWYRFWSGRPDDDVTAQVVAERARRGDEIARRVYTQAAEKLGLGLSMIMDALAPECIVLGGIFQYAGDLLRPDMERVLKAEAHPQIAAACRVEAAGLGRLVGSYASCFVALNRVGVVPRAKVEALGGTP